MVWTAFFVGLFVGGFVSFGAMCLCVISGDESRREELMSRRPDAEHNDDTSATL